MIMKHELDGQTCTIVLFEEPDGELEALCLG